MTADRTRTPSGSGTKTAAKNQPAKKQTTKKSAGARKPSARTAPSAESRPTPSGPELAAEAARQLGQLTGRSIEGVTALERSEDGWRVEVEVLEVRRIPETTDVLATYVVALDDRGRLEGYQRHGRYVRGSAGEDR